MSSLSTTRDGLTDAFGGEWSTAGFDHLLFQCWAQFVVPGMKLDCHTIRNEEKRSGANWLLWTLHGHITPSRLQPEGRLNGVPTFGGLA